MSPALAARVQQEPPEFLDDLGYGTWTEVLQPAHPTERQLMIELLERLYNRPMQGFYVQEVGAHPLFCRAAHSTSAGLLPRRCQVFGPRHGCNKTDMCKTYFTQLLTLARHRIAVCATPKVTRAGQYDVCFDTPAVYTRIPGYFDRPLGGPWPVTGTGAGRKRRTGAPHDFQEDVHYFKSRLRALRACAVWEVECARWGAAP